MLLAAGAGAHTRHRQQQTGWCRRRIPEIESTAKMSERDCEKKLHLLWKPKSTSKCEYYKAFISCSFIVFPPISGELLPSSDHCANSVSISIPRLFPQWHETLQQRCSENCRQTGAGINLKVLPGKQSTELTETHYLVPSRVSGSIMDFESSFIWCVNIIIIKHVHRWQGSDRIQSVPLQGAERIHLISDFEHPGIVGSVLSFQIMLKHVEKSKGGKL